MAPINLHAGPAGRAFQGPVKVAVTAQVAAGAGLAGSAVILSLAHHLTDQVPVFATVAVVLAADAVLVWRELRWLVAINLIALAGQIAAVTGLIIEVTTSIAAIKAHQLRQLGVDPTLGVMINLIYSGVGFAIFCWYATRWLKTYRAAPSGPTSGALPQQR